MKFQDAYGQNWEKLDGGDIPQVGDVFTIPPLTQRQMDYPTENMFKVIPGCGQWPVGKTINQAMATDRGAMAFAVYRKRRRDTILSRVWRSFLRLIYSS